MYVLATRRAGVPLFRIRRGPTPNQKIKPNMHQSTVGQKKSPERENTTAVRKSGPPPTFPRATFHCAARGAPKT